MTSYLMSRGYARYRQADPRIGDQIRGALGDAAFVVNVGSGAGNYEPTDRRVVPVEPSATMIRQRHKPSSTHVQAAAEALPFPSGAFDAALACFTVHYWTDPVAGLEELRRVAPARQVVLTWDPDTLAEAFWFVRDYLPAAGVAGSLAAVELVTEALSPCRVEVVPVPHDCTDGFFGAYWRRPAAYLDPRVRAVIGAFAYCDSDDVDRALLRLAEDLRDGRWDRCYGDLRALERIDLGYRLVISQPDHTITEA